MYYVDSCWNFAQLREVMPLMDLDDLRTFVEVVEAGGINKAAQRLGVAKSVVSRRIARIEADLVAQLINRSPRGVGPTDAGREFAERGRRILLDVADARRAVAAHSDGITGSIRIALPLSFGIRRMAPILTNLHGAHPHLAIDANYSDTAVDLLAGRFDAAVQCGSDLKPSMLVARRVASVSMVLVASPQYLRRHGTPTAPSDLSEHECLIYSGQPQRPTWRFGGAKGGVNIAPQGHFHFDNGEGLLQAAEAGLGIAALPDFIVSDGVDSGRLDSILEDYPLEGGALYLVRPPASLVPLKVRTLTQLMVARFGGRTEAELRIQDKRQPH
jgi:DNA-binding transcriptional LysR family regulator